jgi:RecB family exonuclease
MHKLPVITNSELKCLRRCIREHHYRYELRYRANGPEAAPLRFGTLMHELLEDWWTSKNDELVVDAELFAKLDVDPFERARLVAMMTGYHARWRDDPLEVLHVEHQFAVPLIDPLSGFSLAWVLAGKIDAVVRDKKGQVWIVEHKTTSENIEAGAPYWQKLSLDSQLSVYWHAVQELGYAPRGVIYDVLVKPSQKPLKANTRRDADETPDEYCARLQEVIKADPDRYYQRGNVVRLSQEVWDAGVDIAQYVHLLEHANRNEDWPRNPDSCFKFGRPCDYFEVCTGRARLEDPEKFHQVDNAHAELSPSPDTDY